MIEKPKVTFVRGILGASRQVGKYVLTTAFKISTNLGNLTGHIIVTTYDLKDEEPNIKIRIFIKIDKFIPKATKISSKILLDTLLDNKIIKKSLSFQVEENFRHKLKAFSQFKEVLLGLNLSEEDIKTNFTKLSKMGIFSSCKNRRW